MQVEFKTGKGTLLAVKLDDTAYDVRLAISSPGKKNHLCYRILPKELIYITDQHGDLIEEGFELICPFSEIAEDQAKMMVDELNDKGLIKYIDYVKGYYTHSLFTVLDSFNSLMKHVKVYRVNPYTKPADDDYSFYTHKNVSIQEEWQQAQERTGNWIILFKPNE